MNEEKTLITPDSFAVVEVMGHNTFAGKVSEHTIGGTAFIRVDVPAIPARREKLWRGEMVHPEVQAFTKIIGASSIYAITPCSEEVALKVAASKRSVPVSVIEVPARAEMKDISAAAESDEVEEETDEVPY